MIFVQPLYYNFLSHIHIIFLFSLYCFGPMKREKMKVVIKVVTNGGRTSNSHLYQLICCPFVENTPLVSSHTKRQNRPMERACNYYCYSKIIQFGIISVCDDHHILNSSVFLFAGE